MIQRLWQRFTLSRSFHLNGRVVFAQLLFEVEPVQLFDCRQPSGFGCAGKPGGIAMHQIIFHHRARGSGKSCAARLKIGEKIF